MKNIEEILAEHETLKTQNSATAAELASANTALTAEQAKVTDLTQKLAASEAKATTAEAQVATLTAENATLKAAEQNLEKRTAARLTELGINKESLKNDVKDNGGASLSEQFRAITDNKERSKFWAKHRDEILAGK